MRFATLLVRALAAMLLLLLVAAPNVFAKKTTVRFSEYPRPKETELLKALIEAFQREHPDIEIKYEPITDPVKMTSAMVAGTAPDVICWWGEDLRGWAEQGLLADLKPKMQKELDKDDIYDFNPLQMNVFTYRGIQYAVPQYLGTVAIWYNKDLFDEVGVDQLDDSLNWQGLLETARKLTVRSGNKVMQWGLDQYLALDRVAYWIRQNGGKFHPANDNSVLLLDRPQATQALQFVSDLIFKHRVMPVFGTAGANLFANGKAAMLIEGSWSLAFDLPKIKFDLGFAHLPKGPVQRSTLANADGYGMYVRSKEQDAAFTWLKFLIDKQANQIRAQYQGLQPARRSVAPEWVKRLKATYPSARNAELGAFAEAMAYAEPGPLYANQGIVLGGLASAFGHLFVTGDQSAEQAMKQVVPTINAQLQEVLKRKKR